MSALSAGKRTSGFTVTDNMRTITPDGLRLAEPVREFDFTIEGPPGVKLTHSLPYEWALELAQKILGANAADVGRHV